MGWNLMKSLLYRFKKNQASTALTDEDTGIVRSLLWNLNAMNSGQRDGYMINLLR
jgi:hypothetical protein